MPLKKIRSNTNQVTAALIWFFALGTFLVNQFASEISVTLTAALLGVSALTWVFFWRPSITIGQTGLEIQNPIRKLKIDFVDLQAIDPRFGLTLIRDDKKVSVWAVSGRNSAEAKAVFESWQRWIAENV